jgi:hypothetical protein
MKNCRIIANRNDHFTFVKLGHCVIRVLVSAKTGGEYAKRG